MRKRRREPTEDFAAWYQETYDRLVAALMVVAGKVDPARAASEAFTRALERWDEVSRMEHRERWVHSVALNVLRRQWRRDAIYRRLSSKLVERDVVPDELDPRLWDAARSLPLREREAIALRYVLGLTQQEVADAMGIAPGTAASTLTHARNRLARSLGVSEEVVE